MDEEELKQIYKMVDSIPFSRTKKNISRDFADGVMMAELVHHYKPKLVQLHNYPAANSYTKKINNWSTLNKKVLGKLGLQLSNEQIADIVNSVPNAIEIFLYRVFKCMECPEE